MAAVCTLHTGFAVAASGLNNTQVAQFDPEFLRIPVDLNQYKQAHAVPPGTYRIDLYTNRQWKGRTDVPFAQIGNNPIATPCFDAALLDTLGFDPQHLRPDASHTLQTSTAPLCVPIGELFADTHATYDKGALRLNVTAAQQVLRRSARGYVDPTHWDAGITAATLQYRYNGWRRIHNSRQQTSHYLRLDARANTGPWRLRYSATGTRNHGVGSHYRSQLLTVERALPHLNSRLILGQTFTEGQVFSPLSLTGLRLDSDERMRPDSQRGFAPVVQGIAQSTARVRISQLGAQIFEATVPPGPFVIDDLYPTGSSGDLLVTITEADGSVRSFTIDYTGMVELVRPGITEYTLAFGRSRDPGLRDKPKLAQATVRHGVNNIFTGYGGLMVAEGYLAATAGVALNFPIGAVSSDMTLTRSSNALGSTYRGYSWRANWSKRLPVIETNVALAAYRYSSANYFEPSEAFALRDGRLRSQLLQRRNRLILSLNQSLPNDLGTLTFSASSQDYWQRTGRDTQYQLSYNVNVGQISLGLAASRTRNVLLGIWENQIMLSLSAPLGEILHPMHLHTHGIHNKDSHAAQVGVSGVFGDERQLSFNLYGSHEDAKDVPVHVGGGAGVRWVTPTATVEATVSRGRNTHQWGLSATGGMVLFEEGLVFSNAVGDTLAIVQAKDAAGAKVAKRIGVQLDGNGHAVVPHLRPYRQNEVELDPTGLPTDVALLSTSQQVAPTAGAVVLLRYRTDRSYAVLIQSHRTDGSPLPFAATVFDAENREVGHVGQAGQALARVGATEGTLRVRWGQNDAQQCTLSYAVAEQLPEGQNLRRTQAVCH